MDNESGLPFSVCHYTDIEMNFPFLGYENDRFTSLIDG